MRSVPGQRDGHVENELSAADKTLGSYQHPMILFIYFLYLNSMKFEILRSRQTLADPVAVCSYQYGTP